MTGTALIAGATGIVGGSLLRRLVADGWVVHGLARRPPPAGEGVLPVAVDLRDADAVARAVRPIAPTHVFVSAWLRHDTEAENIRVNAALVRNLLAAAGAAGRLRHASLVTGLKHYLGPFEAYGKGALPRTPFREEQPRLPVENFYYAQEDELYASAARFGHDWTVQRPHTIVGLAIGNAMNMGQTLAAYAAICRETGRPFAFPGSPTQWNGLVDVTDARLLASHLAWSATSPAARNEAFNVVNGDVFRWSWMWGRIADALDVPPAPYDGEARPLETTLADAGPIWADIARKHGLVEPLFDRIASPWHTDADLGRPIEVVTDMGKSRARGFTGYQSSEDSFRDLFAVLRARKLIP